MSLTVKQLVAISSLRSRLVGGVNGADSPIGWAHVCELADPWNWLNAEDLVMTTGIGIPLDEEDQVSYAKRCAAVGIAGIVVGENMNAPTSLCGLRRACDTVGLPLVLTERSVSFVAMAKAVVDANQADERRRLRQAQAVYQLAVASGDSGVGSNALMDKLNEAFDCRLSISERGRVPANGASGISGSDKPISQLPIPGFPAARLRVEEIGRELDSQTLEHIALLAAFELSQRDRIREISRRQGSYLLLQLLEGQIKRADAEVLLRDRGLGGRAMVVTAMPDCTADADLHHKLEDSGVPHALLLRSRRLLLLLPDDVEIGDLLADCSPYVGVSRAWSNPDNVYTAVAEACMALASAQQNKISVVRFEQRPVSLIPGTIDQAEALVDSVLGALMTHDAQHGTSYVHSVRVFLTHDRTWTAAARELHIHRQTLVYRMQRVTELTGKKLNSTADVAQLWAAILTLDAMPDSAHRPKGFTVDSAWSCEAALRPPAP